MDREAVLIIAGSTWRTVTWLAAGFMIALCPSYGRILPSDIQLALKTILWLGELHILKQKFEEMIQAFIRASGISVYHLCLRIIDQGLRPAGARRMAGSTQRTLLYRVRVLK